jgi:predicted transcriptional regulator
MATHEKNTVTIGVSSISQSMERVSKAVRTGTFAGYGIYFLSLELLWKTLTPRRWDIIRAMTAQGPMSIREVARRVNRDVKAVHGDVKTLLLNGVVKRTDDGQVEFPYDEVRVEFSVGPETAIAQPDLGEAIRAAIGTSRKTKPLSKPRAKAA